MALRVDMASRLDRPYFDYGAFAASFERFGRSVWAITLRELRVKYGKRRLGLFWAVVEPLAYVFGLTYIMSFVHDQSPLGGHLAPFIATGMMPYMLVSSTEAAVRGAIRPNAPLLVFPRIRPIDLFIGRWIIEVTTLYTVTLLLFVYFILAGLAEPPAEFHRIVIPMMLAPVGGFALGIVNAAIISVFRPWTSIYQVISRILFFTSGIFFTATNFPPQVKEIMQYQPVLHITEWVRSGYYAGFESKFFDPLYPAAIVWLLLLFALALERVNRVPMTDTR